MPVIACRRCAYKTAVGTKISLLATGTRCLSHCNPQAILSTSVRRLSPRVLTPSGAARHLTYCVYAQLCALVDFKQLRR
ncbi:hypothetical protein KCP75_00605 [Salmonella enterica subsp. enterica]|nr:hypothetical protein KCP75_00605 [Salmonella enterica subsp. enterica]